MSNQTCMSLWQCGTGRPYQRVKHLEMHRLANVLHAASLCIYGRTVCLRVGTFNKLSTRAAWKQIWSHNTLLIDPCNSNQKFLSSYFTKVMNCWMKKIIMTISEKIKYVVHSYCLNLWFGCYTSRQPGWNNFPLVISRSQPLSPQKWKCTQV